MSKPQFVYTTYIETTAEQLWGALTDGDFTVSLIPATLAQTTLGIKQSGARVNLEVDVIAKYTERLLARRAGRDDPDAGGAR